MKNKPAFERWENFVQKANGPSMLRGSWIAASASRLCSDHFLMSDYNLDPSLSNGFVSTKKVCHTIKVP